MIVAGFIVPGMPHPFLAPEANPAYARIRDAYGALRQRIQELQPDLLVLYSTKWLSVIGHQVQTDPAPKWVHVDEEWHELGSIPYEFCMDQDFGEAYVAAGRARGLEMRSVAYHGFPIDTGSIVALKLLTPDNEVPASIVSCNMYADRAETIVLGKAARDAIEGSGKRVVVVAVTALSNRLFTDIIPFAEDHIHSRKDDEWNRKYLEFLSRGRLEDASQLAREFASQANGDQKMKAIWWLSAVMGQHNRYQGEVHAYEGIYGTGAAVVSLVPSTKAAKDKEYDEDDPETHHGDRNVLGGASRFESGEGVDVALGRLDAEEAMEVWDGSHSSADLDANAGLVHGASGRPPASTPSPSPAVGMKPRGKGQEKGVVHADQAPAPVGAYPHARQVGEFLYLSGLGPRDPKTNEVPGGPAFDDDENPLDYDIEAQTEAVIRNMKTVLASCGATIEDVVDVTCYLINMRRDFKGFNKVYAKHFGDVQAARTTLEIGRLPTPIAVEFKVVAKAP